MLSYICSAAYELGSVSLVILTTGYRVLHLLRLVQAGHPQVLDTADLLPCENSQSLLAACAQLESNAKEESGGVQKQV